ncbi:MAG: hypothetical protein JNK64_23915 [Myxococcales bacterium]|nr:hypothetical protein [Myxococcales bacterium]
MGPRQVHALAAVAMVGVVACGGAREARPAVPADARPPTDAAAPVVDAATPGPPAWAWSAAPDLFPAVDQVIEQGGARYVVALGPGRDDDWDRPITLTRGGPSGWTVAVGRGGHLSGALVAADDDRIYVATYGRIQSGVALAAYAVGDGAAAWAVRLDGMGPIGHSKYSMRAQLRMIDGHPTVFGSEAKRWIEARDAATGALRSNQRFDQPPPAQREPEPIAEPLFAELDHMLATRAAYAVGVDDFLARHVRMVNASTAERRAAFADAVAALDDVALQHGRYHLAVALVDDGGRLTVRASRR